MSYRDDHDNVLYFEEKAMKKMKCFVGLCRGEIAGLGRVVKETLPGSFKQVLVVKDVKIFDQEVSHGHADLDPESIAKFINEVMQNEPDTLSEWRLWWHSHGSMNAFFSGTDTGTIESSTEYEWLVSVVTNHEGDLVARFDMYEPVRVTKELSVRTLSAYDEEVYEECKREVDEKVTEPKSSYNFGFGKKTSVDLEDEEEDPEEDSDEVGPAGFDDEAPLPGETDEEYYERIGYDPATGTPRKGKNNLSRLLWP